MNDCPILRVGPGACATIAEAIALLPPDDGTPARISIAPGVYREKLVLARTNTTLEGAGADRTAIVWDDGAAVILEDGERRGTFRTATLRTDGERITLRGLTIENAAAPREEAAQAIALYADGDHFLCEDCVLLSHQDTLFTAPLPLKEMQKNGFIGPKQFAPRTPQRQTYRRCRIEGDVDFIFGSAAAWFEDCDIVTVDGRQDRSTPLSAYVTAPSTPEGQEFGYVFDRCRFIAGDCPDGGVYLGRPWREHAKTVLLDCELGAHIHPDGFHDWNKPHAHATVFLAEYRSAGPGAGHARAPFVRTLTDEEAQAVTYERFLHSLD